MTHASDTSIRRSSSNRSKRPSYPPTMPAENRQASPSSITRRGPSKIAGVKGKTSRTRQRLARALSGANSGRIHQRALRYRYALDTHVMQYWAMGVKSARTCRRSLAAIILGLGVGTMCQPTAASAATLAVSLNAPTLATISVTTGGGITSVTGLIRSSRIKCRASSFPPRRQRSPHPLR